MRYLQMNVSERMTSFHANRCSHGSERMSQNHFFRVSRMRTYEVQFWCQVQQAGAFRACVPESLPATLPRRPREIGLVDLPGNACGTYTERMRRRIGGRPGDQWPTKGLLKRWSTGRACAPRAGRCMVTHELVTPWP